MADWLKLAIDKLEAQSSNFKGDNKAQAVKSAVVETLTTFAKQESEFAQAIAESDKTLSDVCTATVRGVGNSISDLEVYQKAVQEYFPGAKVKFEMKIDLVGDAADPKTLNFDLLDLVGGE